MLLEIDGLSKTFKGLHAVTGYGLRLRPGEILGIIGPNGAGRNGLGHAGEGETSICLELFPELCNPSKAAGVVPQLSKYLDVKWEFSELTNTGATGNPTKATPEKGKKMRQALVDTMGKALSDLDARGWDWRSPEVARG